MCSICRCMLSEDTESGDAICHGVHAHIEGENPTAARYNPEMSDKARQHYKNLILLCLNHHDEIDKNPEKYPVSVLIKIKDDHIQFLSNSIMNEIPNLTFAELEVIQKYLANTENVSSNFSIDYDQIAIEHKLKHNQLSGYVKDYIAMGLSNSRLVENFINSFPDPNYSNRLKNIFKDRYSDIRKSDESSEEVFYDLLKFSTRNFQDSKTIAAGVTILAYYFQICEVFEK